MAENRANDPKRRFVYPNKYAAKSHERRAQEHFLAHGSNKGVNKKMDIHSAMEKSYEATAPTAKAARKDTVNTIDDAGNLTEHQQKQIKR